MHLSSLYYYTIIHFNIKIHDLILNINFITYNHTLL